MTVELTKEIFQRCKLGDDSAFRELVETYQSYGYALAVRFLCHEEDARDVVQESFIRVWKYMHTFNVKSKFTTWYYRIVTNLCLDKIKMKKRKATVSIHEEKVAIHQKDPQDLEEKISNRDLIQKIISMTEKLPNKQRLVFVLRDLQDLPIVEVSQIMKVSPGSVKSNLSLARKKIRQHLEAMEKAGE